MGKQNRKVRMRYAPSPTGFQHVGGIRTAILNYLVARSMGGELLLRIEDTDMKRFVAGTEQYILDTLLWLGITYTEGPDIGGPYGPYQQSRRKDIYRKYALQLVAEGKAYYAFDTPEVLDQRRQEMEAKGQAFMYNCRNRNSFDNSLFLTAAETIARLRSNQHAVIRLKMPDNINIKFYDLIRGDISVNTSELEDRVLLKSDGWPTYHLAHVVDDRLMEITHVLRGEEWLPSAPVHYYLYDALGWGDYRPDFAHLPLVLNPDGKGKLSKRKFMDARTTIFPISWTSEDGLKVKGMREEGFLPEAMINILVLLGWHASGEQEIYLRQELESLVTIHGIQKSGARFDYEKAKWINKKFIEMASVDDLTAAYLAISDGAAINLESLRRSLPFLKGRIFLLREIDDYDYLYSSNFQITCFTAEPNDIDILQEVISALRRLGCWEFDALRQALESPDTADPKSKEALTHRYRLVRTVLSGKSGGLDVATILSILGREISLYRLYQGVK